MIRSKFDIDAKLNEPVYFLLASDLHTCSIGCQEWAIKRDMDRALELKAKILIFGDVFEAILPGDKRHQHSIIPAIYAKSDDLIGAMTDHTAELLFPYIDNIEVIGMGNHCRAVKNKDMIRELLDKLKMKCLEAGKSLNTLHGGYSGRIMHRFCLGNAVTHNHFIKWHHGHGGDSYVTQGIPQLTRMASFGFAHIYASGHTHTKASCELPFEMPTDDGGTKIIDRLGVKCGNYRYDSPAQEQFNAGSVDYTEVMGMAPKPIGGTFVSVKSMRKGNLRYFEQYAMT